jgi:Flp pilus assembly CpaE family ATPase
MGSFSWAGLAVEKDSTNRAMRKRRIIFFGAKGGTGTTKKRDCTGK